MQNIIIEQFKNLKNQMTLNAVLGLVCLTTITSCGEFERVEKVDQYNANQAEFIEKYGHNQITHEDAVIAPDQDLTDDVFDDENIKFIPLESVEIIDDVITIDSAVRQNKVWIISRRDSKDTLGAAYPEKRYAKKFFFHH